MAEPNVLERVEDELEIENRDDFLDDFQDFLREACMAHGYSVTEGLEIIIGAQSQTFLCKFMLEH